MVRSEATGTDKYAAFDIALGKLLERVRRAKDRRKVHRGQHRPTSLREASTDGFSAVGLAAAPVSVLDQVRTGSVPAVTDETESSEVEEEYSPVVIRQKVFASIPMTVDDALYYMELVGHDFYLFVDQETKRPSVVYRRKGWDYGVIALDDDAEELQEVATASRVELRAARSDAATPAPREPATEVISARHRRPPPARTRRLPFTHLSAPSQRPRDVSRG